MKTITQNSKHSLLRSAMAAFIWCVMLPGFNAHSQAQFQNFEPGLPPAEYPFYIDADGDSYGTGELVNVPAEDANTPPAGYSLNNTDCDDNNADVFQLNNLYFDFDGDGHTGIETVVVCFGATIPPGYSWDCCYDCDDNNPEVFYAGDLFIDSDGDGYSVGEPVFVCSDGVTVPPGYTMTYLGEDCNDNYATTGDMFGEFYVDHDGDGYTNGTDIACLGAETPVGYSLTSLGTDCNDNDATKWQVSIRVIEDADGDGWGGDNYFPLGICYGESLAGYIPWPHGQEYLEWDCDDSNPEVYYGVPLYVDSDGDGWDSGYDGYCTTFPIPAGYSYSTQGSDCDDTDGTIWHSAALYIDMDGDGYDNGTTSGFCYGAEIPAGYSMTTAGADCDDTDATVWHSAALYIDGDGDGYDVGAQTLCYGVIPAGYSVSTFGSDCNDNNAAIHPGATEITNNGIDENCNGMADDAGTGGQNTTVIKASQCGTTLSKIYTNIVAVANVPNVTMYTFEVTDENNLVQTTPGSNVNYFQLTSLADYQYEMNYSVRVGLHINGVWQGYGPACTVRTPNLNIGIPQCGTTLAQRNSPIFITAPSFLSSGEVRVTNQTTLATQTIALYQTWFTIKMFPAADYAYSTSYSIEVRAATTGAFSDWTTPCTITTPAAPGGKAGNTDSPITVVAYPNPSNDTFALNLQSASDERVEVKVYDMVGKLLQVMDVEPTDLEAQRLGNEFPTGVYNVVVTQGGVVESLRVIKR